MTTPKVTVGAPSVIATILVCQQLFLTSHGLVPIHSTVQRPRQQPWRQLDATAKTGTSLDASIVGPSDLVWDDDNDNDNDSDGSGADNTSISPGNSRNGDNGGIGSAPLNPNAIHEGAQQMQKVVIRTNVLPGRTSDKTKSLIPSSIFNLIKAIIGCGVLALPSGLAAVSDSPKALIPAIGFLSAIGGLSAYTFGLYGRLVHQTQATSLGELWERQKSKSSSWIISVSTLLFCFGAALSYTIMLGDVAESFAQVAGASSGILASRAFWVPILAVTTLLPLCNLQSLAALAPMSLVGVFAILFTTAFVGFRCPAINPASPYSLAAGGSFLASLSTSQLPLFNTFSKGIAHPASLILGGMAATSFMGHFSAPDFYHTLKDSHNTNAGQKQLSTGDAFASETAGGVKALGDFIKVTTGGFSAIVAVNIILLTLGFLTFGGNSMGILLNNYSSLDPLAAVCRMIMAVNVIGGFPFVFRGCRSEIMTLINKKGRKTEKKITKAIMGLLLASSLLLRNAGFVIGFNGAVMGSAIVYIFPSLLFLSHTKTLPSLTRTQKMERWLCRFLVGFGGLAVVAGGAVSIINAFFPHLLA